uniref:Adipose-secreted signaling protein n=1 Tax=Culex tarsalis TaxID=7177 RepID=A0A1Q3FKY3_CULTA
MGEEHHVHFDAAVINDELHDNTVIYQISGDGKHLTVHLGFLQIKHRYRLELNIPVNILAEAGFDVGSNKSFAVEEETIPNINCKLLSFSVHILTDRNEKQHYAAVVEFFAHKEKLLKEHLKLCGNEDQSIKLNVTFVARVLGRGKGTPMLRDGIHLISAEDNEESELSDWQGFPTKE